MKRQQSGYALLSIMALGATTLAFLMSLAYVVQQSAATISQNKYDLQLLNAAEIGVDYALSQFNTTYPCALDPPQGASQAQTTLNPAMLTNDLSGVTVIMTVKTIVASTDWQTFQQISSIYSRQLDPNKNVSLSWKNPLATNLSTSGYRIIESQAIRNGTSRTIRCFIQARFDVPQNYPSAAPATGTGLYFSNPIFSNGLVNLSNVGSVGAISPSFTSNPLGYQSYNFNVATNTQAQIGSGTTIAGNVQVLTATSGDAVPTGPTASFSSGSSPGLIDGRLTVNGTVDSSTVQANPGAAVTSGDNVLANADIASGSSTTRQVVNNTAPDAAGAGANTPAAQVAMSPAQSGGATVSEFPAITASSPNVPAGSYTTTDFSTGEFQTTATIGSSTDTVGNPVSIYVQDGANPAAVQITSSMFSNMSGIDSNLQIWYSGSKPVNINLNGPSFVGVVYAPNATVNITGQGNFTGAVVAGNLNTSNVGNISIDTGLSSASAATSKAGLTYSTNSTGSQIQGWQAVTWQELKP
jgi:hypothetical protein